MRHTRRQTARGVAFAAAAVAAIGVTSTRAYADTDDQASAEVDPEPEAVVAAAPKPEASPSVFYARASGGPTYVKLDSLVGSGLGLNSPDGVESTFSLGFGARFGAFTIGPRGRALWVTDGTLWQLGAEIALRIPIGDWEPFVGVEGGYSFANWSSDAFKAYCFNKGNYTPATSRPPSGCTVHGVNVTGGDVGLLLGLDRRLERRLSLGGEAGLSIVALSRGPLHPEAESSYTVAYGAASQTVGFGARLGLRATFHF